VATDYAQLTENLLRFYNFSNQVVLFVGAAGRQLLDPSCGARKLIAIDQNAEGLAELAAHVAERGLGTSLEVLAAKFEEVACSADVVYFEFCLHEMGDPQQALTHAKSLARDIVVFDHSPGSEWIFYGAEEDAVLHSAQTMKRFGVRRQKTHHTEQRFADYAELYAKVSPQGPTAIERIERFRDGKNILIPMSYELNLL